MDEEGGVGDWKKKGKVEQEEGGWGQERWDRDRGKRAERRKSEEGEGIRGRKRNGKGERGTDRGKGEKG